MPQTCHGLPQVATAVALPVTTDLFDSESVSGSDGSDTDSAKPHSSQSMFYITHKRKTSVYI